MSYLFIDAFESFISTYDNCKKILNCCNFNSPEFVLKKGDGKCKIPNNFCAFFDFHLYNNTLNLNGRLLDLVVANFSCSITKDDSPLLRGNNHYPALIIEFEISTITTTNFSFNIKDMQYNFRRANFSLIY